MKAMAQAKVSRSPRPILAKRFCREVPGGVVRRSRPEKASRAPMALVKRGSRVLADRRAGMTVNSGTKTTTIPVMKADLAGVVRASPAVWN